MESFTPKGVCSSLMEYEIKDGNIVNLCISNGCDGNNKAMCRLVEGQPVEKITNVLSGIKCGSKQTSCADQLSKALSRHL